MDVELYVSIEPNLNSGLSCTWAKSNSCKHGLKMRDRDHVSAEFLVYREDGLPWSGSRLCCNTWSWYIATDVDIGISSKFGVK